MEPTATLYGGAVRLYAGDCREVLRTLPAESVHLVVTSPPYLGLRDYRVASSFWGGEPGHRHTWGAEAFRRSTIGATAGGPSTTLTKFSGAHFAVMPTALVEVCILAGSSACGVCPLCGAPWERVVSTTTIFEGGSGRAGRTAEEVNDTRGWTPTCQCRGQRGLAVPALVLDPFGGAGTVPLVAQRLGRHAISIDIGPQYVEMQEQRLRAEMPLFA